MSMLFIRRFTLEIYKHRVHYYETDKMGIVHHSNYVRWLEEARAVSYTHLDVYKRQMLQKVHQIWF